MALSPVEVVSSGRPKRPGSVARGKARNESREALGLFPMERMSASRDDHQPRTADRSRERLLLLAGTEGIPIAPDDEGGCFDPAHLLRIVRCHQGFKRRLPHPGRNL